MKKGRLCLLLLLALAGNLRAQEAIAESVVVSASRIPDARGASPFSLTSLDAEELERVPQTRLDDILRTQVPGFSLFRRSSSRTANPTTQGVTLRNFGPSGAGRTLVLLDGIPLNDPFAGYVLWNQIPPALVGNIVVTPGGGAGLFGNAALAGTIFITSRPLEMTNLSAQTQVGSEGTYEATLSGSLIEQPLGISFFAEHFTTGGYPVLRESQRGPVDRNASNDSNLLQLVSQLALDRVTTLQVQLRRFDENRNNGTSYTRNDSAGTDLSASLARRFPGEEAELKISGYYQQREFRSTFSAIDATRTREIPSLNQFSVPADAAGGSLVWSEAFAEQHTLTLGADTRWVNGETNELFRFVGNDFTRLRVAGGQEFFGGLFAEDQWKLSSALSLVGGARLDYWQLSDGRREEFDRATQQPTLSQRFEDRDGFDLNGRLGLRAKLGEQFSLHAGGYTGFRVPTLNELYRPFRVGNTTTEANAALKPEQLMGAESGFDWRPVPALSFGATAFYTKLEDAVGNVTISATPASILRQRQNIDRVSAPGLELSSAWQINSAIFLRASYLFTEPTIERASDRALIGRALAQTPKHTGSLSAEWRPNERWLITAQGRYGSRQFEDDQNALPLAPSCTVDAAIFYHFTERFSAGCKVENLLEREIETGKSADGLVSTGAPRLLTLQFQCR